MKRTAFCLFLLVVFGVRGSSAAILLDLKDTNQSFTPYTLNFVAGSGTTDISFAGYNRPSSLLAQQIYLSKTGGGPNLLGLTWTYLPAPSNPLAFQGNDNRGTGTNGLAFGGLTIGSFDLFTQSIATTVGQSYTLSFLYDNHATPSELVVSASDAVTDATVPEPASLAFWGLGALGGALVACRRRKLV